MSTFEHELQAAVQHKHAVLCSYYHFLASNAPVTLCDCSWQHRKCVILNTTQFRLQCQVQCSRGGTFVTKSLQIMYLYWPTQILKVNSLTWRILMVPITLIMKENV